MQMAGMLVNNTIYYFNISNTFSYGLDFLLGGSFIIIFLIYICSYVFEFCEWHRIINTACKADYLGSSIVNEEYLAKYVKDVVDDPDASDETTFRRLVATMIGNGEPIDWSEIC